MCFVGLAVSESTTERIFLLHDGIIQPLAFENCNSELLLVEPKEWHCVGTYQRWTCTPGK